MTTPLVSIVIPTRNGIATLPSLLDALDAQAVDFAFEVIAIDSGSTDGSEALLASRVACLLRIDAAAFNHGLTRNEAIRRARGEFIVLLVQDAVPASTTWLAELTAPLRSDRGIAGSFARQQPRDDAGGITRHYRATWVASSDIPRTLSIEDPVAFAALAPMDQFLQCAFDNVCSCIRRSVWERHPFKATPIAEDVEWAREVLLAGYRLQYAPRAVVVHSHERSAREEYQRTRAVHARLGALFGLRTIPTARALARAVGSSLAVHLRCRPRASLWRALSLAVAWPAGQFVGGRACFPQIEAFGGRASARPTPKRHNLWKTRPTLLLVVHGFPPAASGGTELYAESQARALRARGCDVLVLTRESDPAAPEYRLRRESRDGLSVAWINNTFRETRSFEESYANPAIAAIAERVIDDFRPDVAHIHHLTCLSTTIVHALARRHIPTVFTLHDYWLMCHRGQLLDENFQACDGPGPSGCAHCLGLAGRAPRAGYVFAPAIRSLAAALPDAAAAVVRGAANRVASAAASTDASRSQSHARSEHMREVVTKVTRFLAPSRHLHDRFERFGIDPRRMTLWEYGCDHAVFLGLPRTAASHLRLGFVGSLMVSKAPHLLLEAAARLPPGVVTVDLFGDHTSYHGDDSYRQRLAPLLAAPHVRAHGLVPHDQVARALASIDVLVVPSVWPENSPFVIREAFLAGVPVVASNIGGIPEIVQDGRNGLLFRPGDVDDLHRTLDRLRRDPGLLDTLRSNEPVVRTIDDDVDATVSLYQSLGAAPAGVTVVSPHARSRVVAVVLNFRTHEETLLTVRSLAAARPPLHAIIVVNNDAGDWPSDSATARHGVPVRRLSTGRNLGFSAGMNAGIRAALDDDADVVVMVNSDVYVPPDCLEQLDIALAASPHAGIAGPVVMARADPRIVASRGIAYDRRHGRMRHVDFGLRVEASALTTAATAEVDAVGGCVMAVRRDVFAAIGFLDDDYFFSFEDLDFCLRARDAGFTTVLAHRARAYHEGSRSIGADSPHRLYFAARNHLLAAGRTDRSRRGIAGWPRNAAIVSLNVAHAIRSAPSIGSVPARIGAVARGTWDYARGRLGEGWYARP